MDYDGKFVTCIATSFPFSPLGTENDVVVVAIFELCGRESLYLFWEYRILKVSSFKYKKQRIERERDRKREMCLVFLSGHAKQWQCTVMKNLQARDEIELDLFFQPFLRASRQSLSTNFSLFTVLITLFIKTSTKDLEMEQNSESYCGRTYGKKKLFSNVEMRLHSTSWMTDRHPGLRSALPDTT